MRNPDDAIATVMAIAQMAELKKARDKRTFLEKEWDEFGLSTHYKPLTGSQKRKLKREADSVIPRIEAFRQARIYHCKMVETDEKETDEKGRTSTIWRRSKEDHAIYLAWRDVYYHGFGEVDGKKIFCTP